MPNHVSNRLSFNSDDYKAKDKALDKLKELMKTDESPFDFNVLIPYPEPFASLDKAANEAEKSCIPWNKRPKDGYSQGGYEWCCENWGTKWNAYDIAFDYDCVTFKTAWRTPFPVWAALSKRLDVELVIEYADEDRGRNCGVVAYKDGKQLYHTQADDMPDPLLFARAVIAEQESGDHANEERKLRERVRELEAEVNKLKPGIPPEQVDRIPPDEAGCTRASHDGNKHRWMRFSNHWLCWWCGHAVMDQD